MAVTNEVAASLTLLEYKALAVVVKNGKPLTIPAPSELLEALESLKRKGLVKGDAQSGWEATEDGKQVYQQAFVIVDTAQRMPDRTKREQNQR